MFLRFAFAFSVLIVPVAASAMPVSTFLAKADALRAKGPLALLSGDLKLLTNEIQAAERAGKPKAYCTPGAGVKLTDKDILAAMQAVPVPHRASTSTKDALRGYLARRFPCRT